MKFTKILFLLFYLNGEHLVNAKRNSKAKDYYKYFRFFGITSGILKLLPIKNIKTSIKPNVIILLSDDVGIGDLEVYNSKSKIKTPNLTRMAKNGFRFLDAHSASSKCSPSRYMLLTGRYSLDSGLF